MFKLVTIGGKNYGEDCTDYGGRFEHPLKVDVCIGECMHTYKCDWEGEYEGCPKTGGCTGVRREEDNG